MNDEKYLKKLFKEKSFNIIIIKKSILYKFNYKF